MRDPETVARMVLQSALAWDPDARLIGNVTAAEVATRGATAIATATRTSGGAL